MSLTADKKRILASYLKEKGLHATRQRDLIIKEFFKKHRHLTIEEWLGLFRKSDPKIGYATVYRTLKLLGECGLAHKREFGGQVRYEHVTDHHHDHLICLKCGKIIEFEDDRIEALQKTVCRSHQFRLINHKMELYGYCARCSHSKK
ncbi:MAG: transcriptional repressor [Deltaproteobacteria bacterium]|nr:transcriptional repressor [Deltaproteobacteria bacterium]